MLLKLLMTAAFLWSGFFHGGVLAAASFGALFMTQKKMLTCDLYGKAGHDQGRQR